jgi:hypothetical protein
MHGGPHYSTTAPVSNHQTSNFNHYNSRSQYFWWVFRILGFEGGIGPPTHGGTHYSTEAPVSNHQTSKFNKMQLGIVKKYFEKVKVVVILF